LGEKGRGGAGEVVTLEPESKGTPIQFILPLLEEGKNRGRQAARARENKKKGATDDATCLISSRKGEVLYLFIPPEKRKKGKKREERSICEKKTLP